MTDVIEACVSNVDGDTVAQLGSTDADLRTRRCLEQCGICYAGPFLVLDGILETSENHADIIETHLEE